MCVALAEEVVERAMRGIKVESVHSRVRDDGVEFDALIVWHQVKSEHCLDYGVFCEISKVDGTSRYGSLTKCGTSHVSQMQNSDQLRKERMRRRLGIRISIKESSATHISFKLVSPNIIS
jgi:hypothetical protein